MPPDVDVLTTSRSRLVRPPKLRFLHALGPGLVTGASDDDPSGIATYTQTGSEFGYTVGWTMLFSYPLMVAIQIISARIGRTTGVGIAGNLRKYYPNWIAYIGVLLLITANTINLGADIGAMAEAVRTMIGGPQVVYVIVFGALCAALEIFVAYKRYAMVLKWLTLSLFAYLATLLIVEIDWKSLAVGLLVPHIAFEGRYLTAVVAILGTTISPYLFFWQSSQEVEDTNATPARQPLRRAPGQALEANLRIRFDTLVGMGVSNIVGLSIMATAAATLNAAGLKDIQSAADAAQALKPLAGDFAGVLFALGIVGTGLLAVPILAGSAAYGVGEAFRWPTGLDRKPKEARAFYATIGVATVAGTLLNFTSISPIKALFWSAVVNGVVAAPLMAILMLMAANPRVMGQFTIGSSLKALGWFSTAVMTLAAAGMIAFSI